MSADDEGVKPEEPETAAADDAATSDVAAKDAVAATPGSTTAESTPARAAEGGAAASPGRSPWLLRLGAALIVVLAVVAGVAIYEAVDYRDDYRSLTTANADAQRAQDVASDYAVKAALIDYRNFDPWFASLKTGVNDTMSKQFAGSEPALRDLLGQLQWVSKGTLVGSDIKSQNDGKYVVQVFVEVQVTNVQSPAGVKTTALYPITVDKNNGYAITDISGGIAPLATK